MKSTHVTAHMTDPVVGRRIFTGCWLSAGLGISILQMLLLAQAWFVSRHAIVPACMASVWVLGSPVGMRLRATPRLWGGCLIAATLLWLLGPRLVPWRIAHTPATLLSGCTLMVAAWFLGAIGLAPLLALDCWPGGRSPLPALGSLVESWTSRYWSTERWQVQLDMRALPHTWWWSYLVERARDSKGNVQLTQLASSSVVILGAVWGAVPTPFAAGLAETHELSRLDTLQLAHGCAQEARLNRLVALVEGILIAFLTPVLGMLIDVRHLTQDEILLAEKGGTEEYGLRVISPTWNRKAKGKGACEKRGKRVKALMRCPARPA